jgi:hypothetical protein
VKLRLNICSFLLFGTNKYLRDLDIAELKEEDMPMV